jgi:hypothetical protein
MAVIGRHSDHQTIQQPMSEQAARNDGTGTAQQLHDLVLRTLVLP